MAPLVRTEDLIDAQEVAAMLGLSSRTSVSVYQRRYPDMPRPVIDRGRGRTRLWVRTDVAVWAKKRQTKSAD
jgi:predicted DNA-binding transcriptional regulator AlpA